MAKKKAPNPFPITDYIGPKYFCDREEELNRLIESAENQRAITIFSRRRMGKTGLIKHLHHVLRSEFNYYCVYTDMLNTFSDEEFSNKLISATIASIDQEKSNFFTEMVNVFARYKPRVSIDSVTGNPALELEVTTPAESKLSLKTMFDVLKKEKKKIHIAIDEFQQISNYPTTSIDATIREYIQSTPNCQYLFSGSQRHLLLDLLNNPKKPLFRMMDQLQLHEIGYASYFDFIKNHFNSDDKNISDEIIHEILKWTRRHTFYTQVVCNRLFAESGELNIYKLESIKKGIIKELEMNFLGYRNLLSTNQFKTLRGIANEGSITSVRSKDFTKKYDIAASTAKQSLDFLIENELVYELLSTDKSEYIVYDVFFEHWLKLLG